MAYEEPVPAGETIYYVTGAFDVGPYQESIEMSWRPSAPGELEADKDAWFEDFVNYINSYNGISTTRGRKAFTLEAVVSNEG